MLEKGKPVVLFLMLPDCPIARKYAPEIQRIHREFSGRAGFRIVMQDPDLKAGEAETWRKEFGYAMPVLLDSKLNLARAWSATHTPTAVVLDRAGRVQYLGRIDDRFPKVGADRLTPKSRDLREALGAVLAGKKPRVQRTVVVGCLLPLPTR